MPIGNVFIARQTPEAIRASKEAPESSRGPSKMAYGPGHHGDDAPGSVKTGIAIACKIVGPNSADIANSRTVAQI